jgi:endoglucanase
VEHIPMRMKSCWKTLLFPFLLAMHNVQAEADWQRFQADYIDPSGRVIDSGNKGISHSEGQGFVMLLATHYRDQAVFDTLWQWTQDHLQVRDDKLLAWRWEAEAGAVTDRNNASDGDLFVLWALYRAAELWNIPTYADAARALSADVRAQLVRQSSHGLVLIPGENGFIHADDSLTLNLSYWVFPALRDLQKYEAEHAETWRALFDNGLQLLENARFGRWQLPPDWLRTGDLLKPESELFKPRFAYDAIRIPLYLIWAGAGTPARLQVYQEFWRFFSDAPFIPAWTDLSDDSVDSYNAPAGIRAVIALSNGGAWPELAQSADYYSAVLLLLSRAAQREAEQ